MTNPKENLPQQADPSPPSSGEPASRPPRTGSGGAEALEVGPAPSSTLELLAAWPGREANLADRLRIYIEYLLRQNRVINLTGDRSPEMQWSVHIEDALACAAIIEMHSPAPHDGARILDVGSGGGVPGLLWALLWPDAEVTLLEATGKKARFLEAAAGLLDLGNIRVLTGRAEELAHDPAFRESFDIVTARALASLPTLAEWTLPFLRVDGRLCAIKGSDVFDEIDAGYPAFEKLGADPEPECVSYTRGDGRPCHLLLYLKRNPSPRAYPRKGDLAKRRPIQ